MTRSALTAPPLRTIHPATGPAIAYRELGEGPAVLLVHGWPTSSLLWRAVMPAIAQRNRVIAIDLPGFGGSGKPTNAKYDFEFFDGAITNLLAELDVAEVAIAGHDIGGPVALHWAMANPARVTGIALLNTLVYPEFSAAVIKFVLTMRVPISRDRATSPEGLADIMRLGVAESFTLPDEVIAAVQEPFGTKADRLALARAATGLGKRGFAEIAAGLPKLQVPVEVIYGAQDRILPDVAVTMSRVKRDLPSTQITVLPDCGHFLQEQQPEQIGETLAAFFAHLD
ncbi:alpha/beta fold hydrolase [Pseudonocardia sp. TRM90224]|uniref:alpha/beta fold hydrolase n=1 Tax=Pseudonocardia sp. TRM90224 TaxID=2812678 RepID=UPI001E45EB6B|nr:alpha/beta fold hydrolase [Pseudonocardia sp. TRM90224]